MVYSLFQRTLRHLKKLMHLKKKHLFFTLYAGMSPVGEDTVKKANGILAMKEAVFYQRESANNQGNKQ